jgi:hypothetical protein
MDINVADALNEEIWKLKEKSLDIPDETTSRVLYRMTMIMEELLVSMPKHGTRWEK